MSEYTETLRGYRIEIEHDQDPQNPRDDDNLSIICCAHNKYDLGDNQADTEHGNVDSVYDTLGADSPDPEGGLTTKNLDDLPIVWLPLYLYDHSGITISTTPFSCQWDSGQIGFVWASNEKVAQWCPRGPLETDEDYNEHVLKRLRGEVKEYDHFLRGNAYGYTIKNEETDEEFDTCWGFLGDSDGYILEVAREAVPDQAPKPDQTIIMVFNDDGTVEFTRNPKLNKFFGGQGEMVRISDIQKEGNKYEILWLKGPYEGKRHTYWHSFTLKLIPSALNPATVMQFATYEKAVEHEVAVLNALRLQGVSFA